MKKVRVLVFFSMVLALAFSGSAMAATETVSFQEDAVTTSQTAVFAAFLAWMPNPSDSMMNVDTAISVSNILAAPDGLDSQGAFDFESPGDRSGTVEFFLWNKDGTMYQYESSEELAPGETLTIRLAEILSRATGQDEADIEFTGYGWVVANFDAIAGTYNVTIFGLGFTQNFELLPGLGQGGFFGGIPVMLP